MVKNDFETFYNNLNHAKIEEEWKKIKIQRKKKRPLAIFIVLIFDVVLYLLIHRILINMIISNFSIITLLPIFMILLADIVIYSVITTGGHAEYNRLYKEEIVEDLLKNFFDKVDYIPKKEMPEIIYNECKQYERYDNYYSDDYMEGTIDNKYSIKMADVETEEERRVRNSDGEMETETVTLFSGLFATIYMKKSIKDELVIKENNTIWKKDRLEMDSDEFEKLFDVSASDKIKGMQLLTHDIMDLLITFRTQWKIPYDIVINNNIMYIRLHTGDMFESSFSNKKVIDETITKKYYNTVGFIYSLSKEMIKNVEETQV